MFDYINGDGIHSVFQEFCIKRNREIDNAVLGEIKQIAIENGIKTEYILHEKAIIRALKKQIPQKPDLEGDGYDDNGELIYDTGYCPNCRHLFEVDYDSPDYCPVCGQKLDWSDCE